LGDRRQDRGRGIADGAPLYPQRPQPAHPGDNGQEIVNIGQTIAPEAQRLEIRDGHGQVQVHQRSQAQLIELEIAPATRDAAGDRWIGLPLGVRKWQGVDARLRVEREALAERDVLPSGIAYFLRICSPAMVAQEDVAERRERRSVRGSGVDQRRVELCVDRKIFPRIGPFPPELRVEQRAQAINREMGLLKNGLVHPSHCSDIAGAPDIQRPRRAFQTIMIDSSSD
jgi:hypothetical protein